jgi:hypothetical protein
MSFIGGSAAMDDDPNLLSVLINWFPMLLLIGVFGWWVFLCWRAGAFKRGSMSQGQYLQDILNETKRNNAALEAIITKMDARLSQLEAAPPAAKKQDS